MSATPSDEQQVAVRLTTRLEAPWRVTEAPIQLPTRLTRFGLSEVVNHLLQGQPTRPFDFVLNGELLRGSLAKAMVKHGLSGEEVVVIEYIQLLAPPKPEQHAPNPDWVASIAVLHSSGYSSGSTLAAKAPSVGRSAGTQAPSRPSAGSRPPRQTPSRRAQTAHARSPLPRTTPAGCGSCSLHRLGPRLGLRLAPRTRVTLAARRSVPHIPTPSRRSP